MRPFLHLLSLTIFLSSFLALGACAPGNPVTGDEPQLVAQPDKVSALLAEAADKASNALQTLAAVEQTKSSAPTMMPITGAPPELKRAITINWVGPADQITKVLSNRASYGFQIIGDAPPVPLVVSIDVENKPIIEVLRDVGLQMGTRADLKVDGARRVIEIYYAPVTAGG